MKLRDAQRRADALFAEFDLDGWTFGFDNAKVRFGVCRHSARKISLSRTLVVLNDEDTVEDVLRHEIAHALASRTAGHGREWRLKCYVTGARPDRCYDGAVVQTPEAPWFRVCDNCGFRKPLHRRTTARRACKSCCVKFNGGRFAEEYLLRLVRADEIDDLEVA